MAIDDDMIEQEARNNWWGLGEAVMREMCDEDWEDYVPKEPLIEDPKIRKAVRAWAEANNITKVTTIYNGYGIYGENPNSSIYFETKPFVNIESGRHTITELCGEEE